MVRRRLTMRTVKRATAYARRVRGKRGLARDRRGNARLTRSLKRYKSNPRKYDMRGVDTTRWRKQRRAIRRRS